MKIVELLRVSSLFLACAAWPLASWAWGFNGHRIVGHIAEADLTPAAKAAVRELAHGKSLADVSTWLDEQRGSSALPPRASEWHFDDIPVCTSAPAQCHDDNCAHAQIAKASDTLRSDDKPRQEFALRVLVHLVGDIHQPLHAADNGDRGGNWVKLENRAACLDKNKQPRPCNLHEYWDSVLLKRAMADTPEPDYAAALAGAHALAAGDSASPNDWIAQTHEIAREVAYGKLAGFACTAPKPASAQAPVHGKASAYYDALARMTIERQLARAGHRLGALLNGLLARPAASGGNATLGAGTAK